MTDSVKGRKKGSPKVLSDYVHNLINKRSLNSNDRNIPREQLADSIIKEIEEAGYSAPTFETTLKYISRARSKGLTDIDAPWSIGSCIKNNIPAETIPVLLKIVKGNNGDPQPLSIREARWIAKLSSALIPSLKKKFPRDWCSQASCLLTVSSAYALREQISEILGRDFPDTSDIDKNPAMNGDISLEAVFKLEIDEISNIGGK